MYTHSTGLERQPLGYCKCDGNVTFIPPFLMLGKLTFDEHVNVLERFVHFLQCSTTSIFSRKRHNYIGYIHVHL